LELARVETPERLFVLLIVIAIAFPALATWYLVGDHSTAVVRALAAIGGSAIAVLVMFISSALKLPAIMEAEAEDERQRLAAQLQTQDRKRQLRDALGEFMLEGAALKRECSDQSKPEPEEEANQWLEGLVSYLQDNLGVSYVARVNDGSPVPLGMTSLNGNRAALDSGLRIRL